MAVYSISLKQTGESFPCSEDEFVLAALRRSGNKTVESGCYGGGCGVCKMQILEGKYKKTKKMSRAHVTKEEEEEGYALLCCIKPESDMTISKN